MSARTPITSGQSVALYDSASGLSWNEKMSPADVAVHYSSFDGEASSPFCTILGSLADAEAFAHQEVRRNPALRCRIYSADGFVGAPLREIRGAQYKAEGDISTKFRRWGGGGLLVAGLLLMGLDWINRFRLSWPALVGSRMVIPGAVLLVTEGLVILNARQKSAQAGKKA